MCDTSVKISIRIIDKNLSAPVYMTAGAAGMDLCAGLSEPVVIKSGEIALIPAGIQIALPDNYEAQIRPRSGLALKYGITVLNAPGTIDSDFRGEIKVILINHGQRDFTINHGDRIAQMVIAKYEKAEWTEAAELDETARSSGGYGHTGV